MEVAIKKNKIDLEHQAMLQERNAILLALVGVPTTLFNISITLLRWDILAAGIAALLSVWVLLGIKSTLDAKIKSKVNELDRIV